MTQTTKIKVKHGLYTINRGELPLWVEAIVKYYAYTRLVGMTDTCPWPKPTVQDIKNFETEYPDMAREWVR